MSHNSLPQLNSAQQEAVNYVDGPLLIIAGAGTGKTTVITEKIAHIIEQGLAEPEEIVALTFTDKAAEEMEERVQKRLSLGYREIQIATFHRFCQRLLQDFGMDIGLSRQTRLLSQTEIWLLLQKHWYEFDLDYYRPIGNPYSHIHSFIDYFSRCKDALISPQMYLQYVEEELLNNDDIHLEDKNRYQELGQAYHQYQQILQDAHAFDFGDLLFQSVRLLQERLSVCEALQKQYKYILVDEFQDVNWAQYQFIRLLGANSQVTAVGDDDQAIYAFRGANVSNILRFQEDFPGAKPIVLTENYRSVQPILDLAYTSIQENNPDRLEARLSLDKRLQAHRKADTKESVAVQEYAVSRLEDEVATVIQEITQLKKNDLSLSFDDIALLVRANNHAEPFMHAFEQAGIPYESIASAGLYRQPIVMDCLHFFHAIDDQEASAALYQLLRLPCIGFSAEDLHRFVTVTKQKSLSYYDALQQVASLGISAEGVRIAQQLLGWVEHGARRAQEEKPGPVLYSFLEDSGYLSYIAQKEEEGDAQMIRQVEQLKQWFDLIAAYEQSVPEASVHRFMQYYAQLRASGDDGDLYHPGDTYDSVNVMTIHGSKGLEFRYVFLVNVVEGRFPSRARREPMDIPEGLLTEQRLLVSKEAHYQEERRLFYVALTRAKDRVYLIHGEDYGGVRKKKVSRFLAELHEQGILVSEDNTDVVEKESGFALPKKIDVAKREAFYQLPGAFSFSQLQSYDRCPYQYKLQHVLQIPKRGNAALSFGQSIHQTLQRFYEEVQRMNQQTQGSLFSFEPVSSEQTGDVNVPRMDRLIALYDEYWQGDWYQDKTQRLAYYDQGKKQLRAWYRSQEEQWTVPVALEAGFNIRIENYRIVGRMDRIDPMEDGHIEIIDYKTGKPKEKLKKQDKEQLLLYQLAASTLPEYTRLGKVGKLSLYYLEDNSVQSFLGTEAELEEMKTRLAEECQQIEARSFEPKPSAFVCNFCDFKEICQYRAS